MVQSQSEEVIDRRLDQPLRETRGQTLDLRRTGEFTSLIAGNPKSVAVIADTGGVRKVRWASDLDSHDKKQLREIVKAIPGRLGV